VHDLDAGGVPPQLIASSSVEDHMEVEVETFKSPVLASSSTPAPVTNSDADEVPPRLIASSLLGEDCMEDEVEVFKSPVLAASSMPAPMTNAPLETDPEAWVFLDSDEEMGGPSPRPKVSDGHNIQNMDFKDSASHVRVAEASSSVRFLSCPDFGDRLTHYYHHRP
jgi:hypothetical protein